MPVHCLCTACALPVAVRCLSLTNYGRCRASRAPSQAKRPLKASTSKTSSAKSSARTTTTSLTTRRRPSSRRSGTAGSGRPASASLSLSASPVTFLPVSPTRTAPASSPPPRHASRTLAAGEVVHGRTPSPTASRRPSLCRATSSRPTASRAFSMALWHGSHLTHSSERDSHYFVHVCVVLVVDTSISRATSGMPHAHHLLWSNSD